MRNSENTLTTVESFVSGWQTTPHGVRIGEVISVFKETHRLTDEYPFYLDDKGIYIRPQEQEPGKDKKVYVRGLIKRDGYPESAEARVFDQLEKWMKTAEEGTAVWVSPPFPEKYPCWKIITHQVNYELETGEKVLRNSAILFDAGEKETLETIRRLFPKTQDTQNLEELRSVLLLPDRDFNPDTAWEKIASLDPNVHNAKQEMSEEELLTATNYISSLINEGVNGRQVALEMQRMGLLGRFSISCPPPQGRGGSFSEMFGGVGSDHLGPLQFECPGCHKQLVRPYGRLIPNCYYCGATVRC